MAAEIAATSAVCACLAAGASFSRSAGLLGVGKHAERTHDDRRLPATDSAQFLSSKLAWDRFAARAQPTDPIATSLQRPPSVLDILEGKWFGSVSSNSSGSHGQLHDSAGSMSPPDQRQRMLEVASGHDLFSGAKRPNFATSLRAQPTTARSGGAAGDSSSGSDRSHASSASRQIISARRPSHSYQPPSPVPSEPDTPHLGTMSGNVSALDEDSPLKTAAADSPLKTAAAADSHPAAERLWRDSTAAEAAEGRQHSGFRAPASLCPAANTFGTWAVRQKHFPQAVPELREEPDAAAPSANSGANGHANGHAVWPPRQPPHAKARAALVHDHETDDEDRAAQERAWRWRFGRRWAAEQAKQFDPNYGKQPDDDDDGWDAALGYLDACGTGFNLQIGRTTSVDKTLSKYSLSRDGSASFMLMGDDSVHGENEMAPRGSVEFDFEATRSLGNMARKAQTLLDEQKKIDTDVARQWGDARAAGVSWVGQFLPAVSIDMHGQFGFVLLRAADRSGMHKLMVRGKGGNTHTQLLQAARQEAAKQAKARQVPPVSSIEVVGSGRMEWSRERDRCLNVSQGRIVSAAEGTVRTHQDVARLAGALTSCTLPMNYRVMVEGQRLI